MLFRVDAWAVLGRVHLVEQLDPLGLAYLHIIQGETGGARDPEDAVRPFDYDALHRRGVGDFADITNLSKQLRAELAEHFRIGLPQVETARTSADGTVKYLLRLHDGATIEAVDIPDGERRTFCISSQAG